MAREYNNDKVVQDVLEEMRALQGGGRPMAGGVSGPGRTPLTYQEGVRNRLTDIGAGVETGVQKVFPAPSPEQTRQSGIIGERMNIQRLAERETAANRLAGVFRRKPAEAITETTLPPAKPSPITISPEGMVIRPGPGPEEEKAILRSYPSGERADQLYGAGPRQAKEDIRRGNMLVSKYGIERRPFETAQSWVGRVGEESGEELTPLARQVAGRAGEEIKTGGVARAESPAPQVRTKQPPNVPVSRSDEGFRQVESGPNQGFYDAKGNRISVSTIGGEAGPEWDFETQLKSAQPYTRITPIDETRETITGPSTATTRTRGGGGVTKAEGRTSSTGKAGRGGGVSGESSSVSEYRPFPFESAVDQSGRTDIERVTGQKVTWEESNVPKRIENIQKYRAAEQKFREGEVKAPYTKQIIESELGLKRAKTGKEKAETKELLQKIDNYDPNSSDAKQKYDKMLTDFTNKQEGQKVGEEWVEPSLLRSQQELAKVGIFPPDVRLKSGAWVTFRYNPKTNKHEWQKR